MPQKQKWILGAPMYGFDWTGAGGSGNQATPLEYADISALIARVGATPRYDAAAQEWTFTYSAGGQTHTVWYLDSPGDRPALRARRRAASEASGSGASARRTSRLWGKPLVAPGAAW